MQGIKVQVHTFLSKHHFSIGVFFSVVFFVIAMGGLVVANGEAVRPEDSHVVNLSIDGQENILPTRALTVGDLLAKQQISLGEFDRVQPAADSYIDGDNFHINVYRAEPLTIIDGSVANRVLSSYENDREAVVSAGYTLQPEDDVQPQFSENFYQTKILGRTLRIVRANAVTVNLYGTTTTKRTKLHTVGELLAEMQITAAADDTLTPSADTPISDGMNIFITKFGKQIATVEEAIPQETEYVTDTNLPFGAQEVREAGSPGKRIVTYELSLENGREVGRTKLQESVVTQPVKKVIARGLAINVAQSKREIMAAAGIAESDFGYVDYIIGRESGWCHTKWQGQWGVCPEYYAEKFPGSETVGSLGFGLCQSTPAIKMASAGADWRTNAVTQLRWCSGYALGRYGSWRNAYERWLVQNWW